jgi:hypothetical protein
MNHHAFTSLAICAFLGNAVSRAGDSSADARVLPLDLRSLEAYESRIDRVPETPGLLRVVFQPAEWPNVKLSAARGQPWNWSTWGFLVLDLKNLDPHEVSFGIRIDTDPAAHGTLHSRAVEAKLKAGEAATFAIDLTRTDPMAHGMRGLPAYPATYRPIMSRQEPFDLEHVRAFQIYLHRPAVLRTLELRSACLASPISLEEIVDPLGQYAKANWPGKVLSESDMCDRHEREVIELKTYPIPWDRDRFGGWRDGPQQAATGYFRTAKLNRKWWLVDPDGALFFSLGIDVVAPNESTIITGRESMFTKLPVPGDRLARYFSSFSRIHSGPVKAGRTFNYYAANLERTYGSDPFHRWKETALNRLNSWGFNTIGNWSDSRLYRNGRIPYVATVSIHGDHARVGSGSDYWGKMHDPFDPEFTRSVQKSLHGVVTQVKGDPWCLGYFVDNELSWGGFGDAGGRYGLGVGALSLVAEASPAKRAMLDQLKRKYGDINRLNAAWGLKLGAWRRLDEPWQPTAGSSTWSVAMKADLSAFVRDLASAYFRTVRDRLKAMDPDHLYLGCRFAWRTEEAVAASAEFCDVVSFNIYERRLDPIKWSFLTDLGRPVMIGEFHSGALDRGMFHSGLVAASNQLDRAAMYSEYVSSALDHPALVGCHWFQYVDEPLTGRSYDGENYNIGFVTVTDTPYPELVAAARAVHRQVYSRRSASQ